VKKNGKAEEKLQELEITTRITHKQGFEELRIKN
jgi:hypothetical protein